MGRFKEKDMLMNEGYQYQQDKLLFIDLDRIVIHFEGDQPHERVVAVVLFSGEKKSYLEKLDFSILFKSFSLRVSKINVCVIINNRRVIFRGEILAESKIL